ncbi:MAG: hypothetical protein LBM08_06375 [Dysgonamonadaceae bacterium]|jgi:hypothetical protein|nr:hypothetical protein [Dysgonamonadaceae bacterium]
MIICIALFSGCDKDSGGGDGSGGLFGGGGEGGGATGNLTGTWTTVSTAGTVEYSFAELTNAVNGSITTYQLDNVVTLTFGADKSLAMSVLGQQYDSGKYSLSGNTLTMTNTDNESFTLNLTFNGNEFTCNASSSIIGYWVAWAIGNAVLKANGYDGMDATNTEVTAVNLTVKFKKQ